MEKILSYGPLSTHKLHYFLYSKNILTCFTLNWIICISQNHIYSRTKRQDKSRNNKPKKRPGSYSILAVSSSSGVLPIF